MAIEPPVAVIGAPLDLGQDRRGVDMGPSAIRYAGLDRRLAELGRECVDWGNVPTPVAESVAEGDQELRFLDQIKATCAEVARLVRRAAGDGYLPLVLGGDHSIALGTLGGLASVYGPGGVLWLDAHGDLNTVESSPSGNEWATPLRLLIDSGAVEADDVVLVGARNLDPPEEEFIAANGVHVGGDAVDPALDGTAGAYVAVDFDSLSEDEVAPFMPEPGGLSVTEAEGVLARVRDRKPVLGAGLTAMLPEQRNLDPARRLTAALGL